jgi:hypothetical protein
MRALLSILALLSSEITGSFPRMMAILVIVIGFGVACFVACFGYQYVPEVCVNRTTIERIAGGDRHQYDAGVSENIAQVFGEHWILWFIPVPPARYGFNASEIEAARMNSAQRVDNGGPDFG